MTANEIAKLFSKGQDCGLWLTKKQTSWLFSVARKNNPLNSNSYGHEQAKGEFDTDNGHFWWTCNEGNYGSSFLKVNKVEDKKEEKNLFAEFITSKGYDYHNLIITSNPILGQLAVEFGQSQIKG